MIVGVMTIDVALFGARTLKDKRRVIKGLKDRLHGRFNVSVAEIGYLNTPKRCLLGVALVSTESRAVHSQLDKLIEVVRRTGELSLVDYSRELL